MREAPVVGGADQPHARLHHLQAMRRLAAAAGQGGQAFSHRRIQAESNGRIERLASSRCFEDGDGLFQQALQHLGGDLHHPFLLSVLVDDPNENLWPRLQTRSPHPYGMGNLLCKGAINAARIGRKAVTAHEQRSQRQAAGTHETHQVVGKFVAPSPADHPCQPEPGVDHDRHGHPSYLLVPFDGDLIHLHMVQVQFLLLACIFHDGVFAWFPSCATRRLQAK